MSPTLRHFDYVRPCNASGGWTQVLLVNFTQ